MIKLFTKKNNLILSAILLILLLFVIISPNFKLIEGNTDSDTTGASDSDTTGASDSSNPSTAASSNSTMKPCPVKPECKSMTTYQKTNHPHDTSMYASQLNVGNKLASSGNSVDMVSKCSTSLSEIKKKHSGGTSTS